jgi:hypothetical protein
MRRSRKTSGEYFSIQHPEFREAERKFIGHQLHFVPDDPDLLRRLSDLVSRLVKKTTRDEAVVEAVRVLGIAALFANDWENDPDALDSYDVSEEARLRTEIRSIVEEQLRAWYDAARSGRNIRVRRCSAQRLRRVGSVLAGDQRGRRRRIVPKDYDLVAEYRGALFRLRRADALLRTLPQSKSRLERVALVAEACGNPADRLRRHLNLDIECRPQGRPWTAEASARIWAANTFTIREQTVSNILSRSRK